jgi:hypothetical protein
MNTYVSLFRFRSLGVVALFDLAGPAAISVSLLA